MGIAGLIGLGSAALFAGARSIWWLPPDRLDVAIHSESSLSIPSGSTIKILIWNIQYAGSRNYHFFYDGGTDVNVSEKHVYESLDTIASIIRQHDPDILLLQEVDRGSRRTQFIDEHSELLKRLDYPDHLSTSYHKVPYVPHPSYQPLGKVDMNLSVFSRFRIDSATRYQLPLLSESKVRQLFNLRRALLEVRFPTSKGSDFVAFNTHLSAFSKHDGTLGKQLQVLSEHMSSSDKSDVPWLLAGDLNALPPGDNAERLGDDAQWYSPTESPLTPLFDRFQHPVPQSVYTSDPGPWRTYLPPGSTTPDRTLDYLFHGSQIEVLSYSVIQDTKAKETSDHLPIVTEIRLH
jgi:endonuclease/exonuclease/phosphatase family metal-dependent hydrolase